MILLTGATGFVGRRLLDELERRGREVRALSRSPEKLADRGVEVVQGDLERPETLAPALDGVDSAYYLVHSLASAGDFAATEQRAAEAFAEAAREAGVDRIVYLGGLARGEGLSDHLASRHEVGRVLRESGVTTIELRASVIIGAGSASFELVRSLVDGLPMLALPSWLDARTQPIAIDDVVAYLAAALDVPLDGSRVYEIGGPDAMSYRELLEEYAGVRGLQTPILRVPLPAPPLSLSDLPGQALQSLAPERALVAAKLIESVRFDSTVEDETALFDFPQIRPRPVRDALREALAEAA